MISRLKAVATVGLLVAAFLVLCALGTWQVLRLQQGEQSKRYREERVAAEPVRWRSDAGMTAEEMDYRRVAVSGRWDNARTMVLTNRGRYSTLGKDAVTPLLPDDGGPAILVDRGWFPDAKRAEVLASLAREERATVEGLARNVKLAPGQRTSTGDWTRLDPATMGKELPYPVVAWQLTQGRRQTLEDANTPPASLPVQLWTAEGKAIPHLDYALTWYGLAVALVVVSVVRFRMQARRRAAESAGVAVGGT